jgi:hypothetical protein
MLTPPVVASTLVNPFPMHIAFHNTKKSYISMRYHEKSLAINESCARKKEAYRETLGK